MVSKSSTSAVPVRARRKAETRAAILAAAFELCSERGLDGPSIDEIAGRAGFTKGAFYASFDSKQDLFMTMIDERFAAAVADLDEILSGDDPAAEAAAAAVQFVRRVNSAPGGPSLFFQFVAYAARDEDFRRRFADRYSSLHERIAAIYDRWARDFPKRPPVSIDEIVTMTSAMSNGFVLEQQIGGELDEQLHGTMLAIFFRGLQAVAVGWEPPSSVDS
jgi:AcrR family transcriptional regulator